MPSKSATSHTNKEGKDLQQVKYESAMQTLDEYDTQIKPQIEEIKIRDETIKNLQNSEAILQEGNQKLLERIKELSSDLSCAKEERDKLKKQNQELLGDNLKPKESSDLVEQLMQQNKKLESENERLQLRDIEIRVGLLEMKNKNFKDFKYQKISKSILSLEDEIQKAAKDFRQSMSELKTYLEENTDLEDNLEEPLKEGSKLQQFYKNEEDNYVVVNENFDSYNKNPNPSTNLENSQIESSTQGSSIR